MKNKLAKLFSRRERGQALAIVLGLMAVGGLTMAVTLNHASTSIKGSDIVVQSTRGIYAADAGIEYAIRRLERGLGVPGELSENVSGKMVRLNAVNKGEFSLYAGELLQESSTHVDWVTVTSNITASPLPNTYSITIERSANASGIIKILELGATLPVGYTYDNGSAASPSFPNNITTDDPDSSGTTPSTAVWIKWIWNPGQGPELSSSNSTKTQKFTISGSGSLEGEYAWVRAQSSDIGIVGEINGVRYEITSNATDPVTGHVDGTITAGVILVGGETQVMSWRISK